jgi:MYXO-CTERM domain-containing protein
VTRRACIVAIVLLLACGGQALAFHELESFTREDTSGGNGSFYTGSPRFKGYDCGICHTGAEERIRIGLEVNRGEIAEGHYEPNTGYVFKLRLDGEHRGLESAFNPNTFTLEFLDDAGESAGSYILSNDPNPIELVDDGRVLSTEGFGNGEDAWSFTWFSPREAPGAITLYIAMLDGDGAGEPELRWIDPLNDDVATLQLRLCPAGESCPDVASQPEPNSPVHCSTGGGAPSWAALLIALLVLHRRRR